MTKENRATKIRRLAKVSEFVERRETVIGDEMLIGDYGQAVLRWPSPKAKQYAVIDTKTGEIVQYVHQSGTVAEETNPDPWLPMIDRRIYYLSNLHRGQIKNEN